MTVAPHHAEDGKAVRALCRSQALTGPTAGLAPGYAQMNLVVLPAAFAEDFAAFCRKNPRPCPLLEQLRPGDCEPKRFAAGGDVRTDLPRYRVLLRGETSHQPLDILREWRPDFTAFLIGCSFTFDAALLAAGVPVRHVAQGCNVPMYRTNIPCVGAGPFQAPLVVSMRPMTREQAEIASQITAAMPHVHGSPVHVGDPAAIGVDDLSRPDYGDPLEIRDGELPVFWACGVTPMEALLRAKPEIAITHEPGHMLVTDVLDRELIARSGPHGV